MTATLFDDVPPCRDQRHHKCGGCDICPCHAETDAFRSVEVHAVQLGVPAHVARNLVAHLRSGVMDEQLTVTQAARVARYVIDLGWRPTIGAVVQER